MIPPTPSATVPPNSSAQLLLQQGPPFVEFPRFSILELRRQKDHAGNALPFSEWLTKRLQVGQPFVIQDFERLEAWDAQFFEIEKLIELSTQKNIPIRNCSSGRDLSFTLRKFADAARQSYQEFQNLYARDLQCPQEWQEQCRKILPTEVQWGGRLDLFQWLPPCARSEVMMAYVGSEGSSSGFHRCFSSTVALNLLVESDDRPAVCIGTDFESQKKYDTFVSARGISPHVDWANLGADELLKADFPLYAYDQKVGDLVVFPPATAHQVWNPATLSTKLVWNILHPLSLEVGFQYVQPPFNRLCHPDVARTNLSLAHAMLSLARDDIPGILPPDLPLLSRLFRQMVYDESIEGQPATPIAWVQVPETVVATCNFCSTAIWNRHVRCSECVDFDLCLACYSSGRGCEHIQSYSWAEIHPPERCTRILVRAREILGFQPVEAQTSDRKKSLGTAVNDLMNGRQHAVNRLCHLCRIDHPEWKGRRCDKCTAFFCFRGLYRHFDMNSADLIRHSGLWTCPKCSEICNCRCCHFSTAYVKSEKPASKRRVKPSDPRGKTMGFTDNVFDQKRGQRTSTGTSNGKLSDHPNSAQICGQKRQMSMSNLAAREPPMRYLELPTPNLANAGDESAPDDKNAFGASHRLTSHSNPRANGSRPTLPGIANLHQHQVSVTTSPETPGTSTGEGMKGLASAAASHGRSAALPKIKSVPSTLPSLPLFDTPNPYHVSTSNGNVKGAVDSSPAMGSAKDTSVADAVIMQKETRLAKLRHFGDELLQLGLEASHKMCSEEQTTLEADLRAAKKQKSAALIESLRREFPGLADMASQEVEKLGYT